MVDLRNRTLKTPDPTTLEIGMVTLIYHLQLDQTVSKGEPRTPFKDLPRNPLLPLERPLFTLSCPSFGFTWSKSRPPKSPDVGVPFQTQISTTRLYSRSLPNWSFTTGQESRDDYLLSKVLTMNELEPGSLLGSWYL